MINIYIPAKKIPKKPRRYGAYDSYIGAFIRTRYPVHASCKLDWTFSESCEDVYTKIVDQINLWDVSRDTFS